VPPDAWAAAVRDCDGTLRAALDRPVKFFRFPLLHQGATAKQRNIAKAVLQELGYQNAHVTIDNSDYLIAAPYRVAVERGDTAGVRAYGRLMLRHDLAAVRHFRTVSTESLGRQVSHILLLHANEMTADNLDELLGALSAEGARFISLDEALRDSAYRLEDRYSGAKGLSWLYRLQESRAGAPSPWEWDDSASAGIDTELARVLKRSGAGRAPD